MGGFFAFFLRLFLLLLPAFLSFGGVMEEIVVPDYTDSAQDDGGALSLDDLASMQAKPAGPGLCDKIPLSRTHALGL